MSSETTEPVEISAVRQEVKHRVSLTSADGRACVKLSEIHLFGMVRHSYRPSYALSIIMHAERLKFISNQYLHPVSHIWVTQQV